MTTVASLQDLLRNALMGATGAGNNVFTPRTWPTEPGEMPALLIMPGKETKISKGRSVPMFDVVGVVRVQGRVYARADAGNAGSVAVLAAAQLLQRQIEVAVINDHDLYAELQSIEKVEVLCHVPQQPEGELLFGEVVMDFHLDFVQGPQSFQPPTIDPIEEFAIFADLVNVFSPTGTFDGTPFAAGANPDPRTAGPDGRAEGALLLSIPQD